MAIASPNRKINEQTAGKTKRHDAWGESSPLAWPRLDFLGGQPMWSCGAATNPEVQISKANPETSRISISRKTPKEI